MAAVARVTRVRRVCRPLARALSSQSAPAAPARRSVNPMVVGEQTVPRAAGPPEDLPRLEAALRSLVGQAAPRSFWIQTKRRELKDMTDNTPANAARQKTREEEKAKALQLFDTDILVDPNITADALRMQCMRMRIQLR